MPALWIPPKRSLYHLKPHTLNAPAQHRYKFLRACMHRICGYLEIPSDKRTQWETMQEFYSSAPHWSLTDTLNTNQTGELPLVWTQQNLTLDGARLHTYAWNGQLATDSQIDPPPGQPTLISQALWNMQQATNPLTVPNHFAKSCDSSQHDPVPPVPTMHHLPHPQKQSR